MNFSFLRMTLLPFLCKSTEIYEGYTCGWFICEFGLGIGTVRVREKAGYRRLADVRGMA